MDRVNSEFLDDLIAKILTAAGDGTKLNINNADEVGQYVSTIIGLGAGLIPYIGTSLGALCDLLGPVLFSPNSMEQIWDALRERIEQLIDQKIEEYHLKILKEKILGFQDNLELYSRYLKDFERAETPEEKRDAANTVKTMHGDFLTVLMAGIPEFQVDAYAVPSLPLFSLVATMHLTLLADGIKWGKGWGYTDKNIETMKTKFKAKTSPSSGSALDDLDYVTYAKKIYTQGRNNVKLEDNSNRDGYNEARNYRACSDYDSSMVLNVLNYAEIWPFMTGDVWTATARRNFDREIFYGPYGRWASGASWSLSSPPPVTDRGDPITLINLRGWDDIDGLELKHGSSWDGFQGNPAGGEAVKHDFGGDEYVTSVMIVCGFKLGRLVFTTNKNHILPNGFARHADTVYNVAPPGYELSSVIITRWSGATPTGCEGIILGFRPLMTDTTRS